MGLGRTRSVALTGLDGALVQVEADLAEVDDLFSGLGRQHLGRHERRDRDREVEGRARLGDRGR